jgi:hypothetical protein
MEASFPSFLTAELALKLSAEAEGGLLVVYVIGSKEAVSWTGNFAEDMNVDVVLKGADVASEWGNSRARVPDF